MDELEMNDIIKAGLCIEDAEELHKTLTETIGAAKGSDPREVWQKLVAKRVLKPWHPHALHQLVYYSVYAHWDSTNNGPPLFWFPSL